MGGAEMSYPWAIFFFCPTLTQPFWKPFSGSFSFISFLSWPPASLIGHNLEINHFKSLPRFSDSMCMRFLVRWGREEPRQSRVPGSEQSQEAVLNRTFCDRNVLHLHWSTQQPPVTGGFWALEMWLVQLRNWIFNFIRFHLNFNSHMWLLAAFLNTAGLEESDTHTAVVM